MTGILKYRDPATGEYLPVPVGAGGGSEEVWVGPDSPFQEEDLWVDTADSGAVYDWSTADARYLTSGFRNAIRNGDMQIAQRGNGSFTTGGYCLDGYAMSAPGGGATFAAARVSIANNLPPAQEDGAAWRLNVDMTGGSATAGLVRVEVPIENVQTFAGKDVVLSFWAISSGVAGDFKIGIEAAQLFGSGGSAQVNTSVGTVTCAAGYVWRKYIVPFKLPSISGKTIGTGSNLLNILFWLSAGSDYAVRSSGIGVQTWTANLANIQLEAGTVATPFERLPVQQQLAWCQRYFQRLGANNPNAVWTNNNSRWGTGFYESTTAGRISIPMNVPMRASPTITGSTPNTFILWEYSARTPTAISAEPPSSFAAPFIFTVSGATANGGFLLQQNGTTPSYFDFSAEL